MRKSLNGNPLVALAIIGVLGLGVGLLLLSSMGSSGSSSTTTTATDPAATAATAATAAPTTPAPTDGSTVAPPATTAPTAVDPATGLPAAPAAVPATPPVTGSFAAGPGLPAPVVTAYKQGDAIALLVVKRNGIDDHAVRAGFRIVTAMPHVTAFQTIAKHVARYARIAEGVDLDRVPALVVVRPKSLTKSGPPRATVTYGFNSPAQLVQAVEDGLYRGPENLPYHPR
jgi:hypothetical protein